MFRVIAAFLATLLCLPASQPATERIRATVLEIPTGSPVRLKTKSGPARKGRTWNGKLLSVTNDSISLQVLEAEQFIEREFPIEEIKSIHQTNKPLGVGGTVLATLGTLWLIGAILSIAMGGA